MQLTEPSTTTIRKRWATPREYGIIHEISEQTLANWRYQDRLAGRTEALPGYPVYRKFGAAVRYLMED